MAKPNFRQTVAEEMIRHIEAGTAPWQKPWQPGVVRSAPFNPLTGRNYRGINAWWLEMQGRTDPRWMTYRQAQQADANVRKGEKGTLVEYWKWTDRVPVLDEAGQPVIDENGKTRMREVRLDRPRVFHAVVFNAEQIEGLAPYQAPAPSFEPIQEAEKILAAGEIPIHHDQADRAFYVPARDAIHLPERAAFKSAYDYYATALHELGHGTGHESRLGREFGPRGSEAYAKEELRAEMAAFMVSTELGLGHYPERHAAYVGAWLKALEDDRNLLFAAARDAEKIRAWIMEPELRPTLAQGQRRSKEAATSIPLPSLGNATARLRDGALEIETERAIELFGGPTPLVTYAVENGLSAEDLGAALRLVGEAAPAKPGAVLDLVRDQLQDEDLMLDGPPAPGQYVGAVVHVGDRYAVQRVGNHLVAHDLAAMDFDGASVAALVQAREAGGTVTFTHSNDGRLSTDAAPMPGLVMAPEMAPPEPSREPSVEERVAMMDAAIARVPEVDRPVLSRAFNSLERRDQRGIEEALARVNWMVLAAEQTQAPDGPALMDAFSRTRRTDWFSGYADSSEEREGGWEAIENLKADLTSLAARSDLNRDLLSVMWHHKVPKEYARRPEWVVPLDDLRTGQVRAFAADPQNSLVALSSQGVDQAPPRTIASDPSVQEVDGEVWWNQRLEDAYEGAQDAEDLAKALAALGPEPAAGEKVLVDANGNRVNHPAPDQPQAERRYLDVPFAEKAQAKAAGAKWDPARKSWYAPAEADPAALARWTPTDRAAAVERAPARGKETTVTDKTERIYLAVPYAEKDVAKALGAKWDRRRKSWYAPEGVDTKALAKWLPDTQASSMQATEAPTPEEEFAEAIRASGLVLEGVPTMDGRWHRVPVEGETKGKLSGSYRGFLDGRPAGQIMNYKTGDKAVQWVATGNRLDPAERDRLKAEAATRKAEHERALRQRHEQVARRAFGIWTNAAPAPADHPYLKAKGIEAPGLRVDGKGSLLVPMQDGKGHIWNLQVIQPDGTKRFLKDGRKTGLMHVIEGNQPGPTVIAEGYATARTLSRASGRSVAVAFDAGNLEAVARVLKDLAPSKDLVIAADDDHATRTNAGLSKAHAAAEAVDGRVIVPPFTRSEKAAGLTDWNDLEKARGRIPFKGILDAALGQPARKAMEPRNRGPRAMAV